MTKEEYAEKLNGIDYRDFRGFSRSDFNDAKESGLVIVYGASDDLMEFAGAIYDEASVFDGGTALIDAKGLLPDRDNIDNDDELEDFFARRKTANKITALWCPRDESGKVIASWAYETDIPHSVFDVIEDGEIYCKGIVFNLGDV